MRPYVLTLVMLLGMLAAAAHGQNEPEPGWEQVDEDEGIRIWQKEVPGIDLPGFRGAVTMEAELGRIVAVILDWRKHTEWMHRCAESSELRRFSDDHTLRYNRTASPWPVWDRDVILETHVERAPDGQSVRIRFENKQSDLRPVPKRVVRMPRLHGHYLLTRTGDNRTQVTYQIEADPGGSLPRWLAARVARDLPFHTLRALRERVSQAR